MADSIGTPLGGMKLPDVSKPFGDSPTFESKPMVQDISKVDRSADDAWNARQAARKAAAKKATPTKKATPAKTATATPVRKSSPATEVASAVGNLKGAFNKAVEATSKNKPAAKDKPAEGKAAVAKSFGTGIRGALNRAGESVTKGFDATESRTRTKAANTQARKDAEKAKSDFSARTGSYFNRKVKPMYSHAEGGAVGMAKGGNPFDMGKKSGKGVNPFAKGKPSKPKGKPPKKKGKNPFAFASGGSIDGCAKRGHTRAKGAK